MTPEQLVKELNAQVGPRLSEALIEEHVRNGHALGFPDCCIRAFVRRFPTPGNPVTVTPSAQDLQLMVLAGRAPCDDCKARMLAQQALPFRQQQLKEETAFSTLRFLAYRMAKEKSVTPIDPKAIEATKHDLLKWTDHFCTIRNTPSP